MRPDRKARGFTLLEVLAAVLILGWLYTVLSHQAIRGLRSEGMDRRRTEAAALADARLIDLETLLAGGASLEPLREETREGDYLVVVEVLPEDVEALLPPPPESAPDSPGAAETPRLLVDERGESRVYRIRVAVSWEDAGQTLQVERTSWDFDRSQLAQLFPEDVGQDGAAGGVDGEGADAEAEGDGGREDRPGRSRTRSGSGGADDPCSNATTIEQMMECLERVR